MGAMGDTRGYLELSCDPVRFEPVSKVTNVFFDDTSKEELLSYSGGEVGAGLTQECRAKSATLLGFIWTNSDELALVTDHGVEYYQVSRERLSVRHLRSYSVQCSWFVWSPECLLLLLCCGASPSTTTLQPFAFKPGQSTKLTKFEVEVSGPGGPSAPGVTLGERDVCVGWVYGQPSACVLRHPASPSVTAALDIYTQNKDSQFKKTYTCRLELTGRFAVNIIDSLIIVHHQASKPFALLEPCALPCPAATAPPSLPCELYSPTWVVFQPDIVIDARLGCMWHLQLRLDCLAEAVQDKTQLVDCLLRRKQAKSLVLVVVRKVVESGQLACLGQIFDKINTAYRQHLNTILQSQMGENVSFSASASGGGERRVVVVEQADMYSAVLAPLMEEAERVEKEGKAGGADRKLSVRAVVGVVVEYTRSLGAVGVTVQHFLYELVINALVRARHFYQLHQLLQYHVLADSKPLACLLLSLVGVYSAGQQLSLDMLCRLNTAHDEIIEVLLSQRQVTPALRYARSVGLAESVSARKFLEAALGCGKKQVFYATFTFFSLRNSRLRGSAAFAKGEHCEVYVEHYKKLFGELPDYSNHQL
ncbi:Regulator of MON1-CCZ1 complex [Chionoecetes opilio]|uniref:Regulator of MON1-CCZ1 complex n=1 Tax=Chionoecetes opilio TaxID=41210 RepID=A0A8J4XP30_CHIOP|nr:Regulator of MON1-CCZ1 complex [Chionoecetes opilio]